MTREEVWQKALPRFVTEIAELWPPQGKWTEVDYFALPEANRFIELSEGRLIKPPYPISYASAHRGRTISGLLFLCRSPRSGRRPVSTSSGATRTEHDLRTSRFVRRSRAR